MILQLDNAGKRFNRDWIFRDLSYTFASGISYAITGANGSGKSTLLQIMAGASMLNTGTITWKTNNDSPIDAQKIYQSAAICAPYLELIEEMTLLEFLQFHSTFKKPLQGLSVDHIIQEIQLEAAKDKKINLFSSGMKQRVKLAQAILFQAPLVLLDEPCTNLDKNGINQYYQLIEKYCQDRLVVVCSNDPNEYPFCKEILNIGDYKKA